MKSTYQQHQRAPGTMPGLSLFSFWSLLILFIFFMGCSDETPEAKGNEGRQLPPAAGEAILRVAIDNGKKNGGTYAPTTLAAHPSEKEVRSLAVFTKTDDVGTPGQAGFKAGAFNRYFSDEEIGTTYGFNEPLAANGDGSYTFSVRIKSAGFGPNTKLLVVANYIENGMSDLLRRVDRWEKLADVQTPPADKPLVTPLLMVGMPAGGIDLADQETKTPTIEMSRVASRIDVVNLAHKEITTEGFLLESIQLFQPRRASYLLAGNVKRSEIEVIDAYDQVTVANPPENDITKVSNIYAYENDNDGPEATKTFLRINGKLFGTPYTKDIPLKQPDVSHQQPGAPIALARNHRYTLNITAPIPQGPIETTFEVIDWSDGTLVDIDATIEKPVIAAPDFSQATATSWDAGKKTYTFDMDNQETVTFKVTALRTPFLNMQFEYGDPAMYGLENANNQAYKDFVKASSVVTYSKVEQTFEISTPRLVDPGYKAPILITLKLEDPSNRYYADSIKFRVVPKYLDTPYQPVLVKGLWWAPLNVGATDIMGAATPTTASTGYYYQWGRNTPFDATTDYTANSVSAENTTYKSATTGEDKDKFVIGTTNSKQDWVMANDPGHFARNLMWDKDVDRSPCPRGWRVPTVAELDKLKAATQAWVDAEKRVKVTGDESGKDLYIPRAGRRNYNTSEVAEYNSQFRLWSSTTGNTERSHHLYGTTTGEYFRAYALPVRCVQ